jgi:hypothetical protein
MASSSNNLIQDLVDAPPGTKRKISYAYRVLHPVAEEPGHPATPIVSAGNAGGLRDTATPQVGPSAGTSFLAGRKRSATSAAPGLGCPAPIARHIALAADFSPSHFKEPVSKDRIPEPNSPQQPPPVPPSPMQIDPQ